MLDREQRIISFWKFALSLGIERERLQRFAKEEQEGAVTWDSRQRQLPAFLAFARSLSIEVGDEALQIANETVIQEQIGWEGEFIVLAESLGITICYVGPLQVISEDKKDEPKAKKCIAKHKDNGFEGQQVYVWDGHYKGRLARVKQMSGGACRIDLETPLFGVSTVVVAGQTLLAYVFVFPCTSNAKIILQEMRLYSREGDKARLERRPRTYRTSISTNERSFPASASASTSYATNRYSKISRYVSLTIRGVAHENFLLLDDFDRGMWLFHPNIAALRKSNHFIVKIESHPDSEVSGRREGRVLMDEEPLTHPVPLSVPAEVKVEYEVKKKNEKHVEMLPVGSLGVTRPRVKARHAIIYGPRVGDVVIYVRSDGDGAQVRKEGPTKDIFYISKFNLCNIEAL